MSSINLADSFAAFRRKRSFICRHCSSNPSDTKMATEWFIANHCVCTAGQSGLPRIFHWWWWSPLLIPELRSVAVSEISSFLAWRVIRLGHTVDAGLQIVVKGRARVLLSRRIGSLYPAVSVSYSARLSSIRLVAALLSWMFLHILMHQYMDNVEIAKFGPPLPDVCLHPSWITTCCSARSELRALHHGVAGLRCFLNLRY